MCYKAGNIFFISDENGTSCNELFERDVFYSRDTVLAEFDRTRY